MIMYISMCVKQKSAPTVPTTVWMSNFSFRTLLGLSGKMETKSPDNTLIL